LTTVESSKRKPFAKKFLKRQIRLRRFYRRLTNNRWFIGLLLATICALFSHFTVNYIQLIRVAENHFGDLRISLLALPRPQSSTIAVVLINEDTLATLPYRSPLDRALIADLLEQLDNLSVAAIGLNVVFDRPTEKDKDRHLYNTFRNIDVPLIVSALSNSAESNPQRYSYSQDYLQGLQTGPSYVYRDHVDQTVRFAQVRHIRGKSVQLGFAAAIANAIGVELPDTERIRIDFRAGPDKNTPPFPVYQAHKLGDIQDEALKGRIVIIGSDLGSISRHRTPLSVLNTTSKSYLPGALIEAHTLSQLMDGRRIKSVSSDQFLLLLIAASLLGVLISLSPLGWILKVTSAVLVIPVAWLSSLIIYIYDGLLLPTVAMTLTYLIAAIVSFTWEWRSDFSQRKEIRQVFGHFLAPTVIDQMLADPDSLELGGEFREITLLFTDLEGFTALTENNSPQNMVRLVNAYLEESCEIVIRHGGTIDKIVGDALHIMFNAPVFQDDHPQRAVECALELDKWSNRFRERYAAKGIAIGATRIGVNTGSCTVGNFGGSKRFDYTAHGDAINSAARLESINQRLGTTICVSESTVNKCTDTIFLPVATLILYGKTQGVDAYYPFTETDEYYHTAFRDEYIYAYSCLRDSKIEASELFRNLLEKYPGHPLVKLHNKRIENGELGTSMVMRKK
jgi:class 3 adenylate cyclase